MSAMDEPRVVFITHPREGAEDFARRLVERRLAACVNMVEARSIYRWEGAIEGEEETLLLIKTTAARLAELQGAMAGEHPFDTPEFVVVDPIAVEPRYLAWLQAETAPEDASG